jgi:hypothetical protein
MRIAIGLLIAQVLVGFAAAPACGQVCTINFDSGCPNATAQCGASFTGGLGCIVAGLPNCYASGSRSYRADANNPVTITIPSGILEIEVFFAHSGAGTQGFMTFFDAVTGGNQVGAQIVTNGDCNGPMPPLQSQAFPSAVRRIDVDISGGGDVWIDSMKLTDTTVPVETWDWSLFKRLYKE